MLIISHRGYWKNPNEKNTPVAFHRSFDLGFGTETDVRDFRGTLVISHDVPSGAEITLAEMLDILGKRNLPLALNIKADGLSRLIAEELQRREFTNWFTFDMSIPELVSQIRGGLPAFTRVSEFELYPVCYEAAIGVWLDAFNSEWYDMERVARYLEDNKRVCIVSPELHKRDHQPLWTTLRNSNLTSDSKLILCTDLPEDAKKWFEDSR